MKKLIALTLSLAIVLSFSFVVMADPTITMSYTGGVNGTFTATVDSAVVGDQATLLAYPTTELGLVTTGGTNIEYIDQLPSTAGTTVFEFKMKNDVIANQAYTIKVGGSLLSTPLSVTNYVPYVVETPTTFTISGTVSNAADTLGDETFDAAFATTVNILSAYGGTAIGTSTVDMASKTFSIADVAPGNYVVEILRTSYLPRYFNLSVDGNEDVGDTIMLAGDIEFDGEVNGVDSGLLFSVFGKTYEDAEYETRFDLSPEGEINGVDTGALFANFGESYLSYPGADEVAYE